MTLDQAAQLLKEMALRGHACSFPNKYAEDYHMLFLAKALSGAQPDDLKRLIEYLDGAR